MNNTKIFNLILLITFVGEFLVPFILKFFYPNYQWTKMAMSVLGSPESPVKYIYRFWLIWLGFILCVLSYSYYQNTEQISFPISIMLFVFILIFAIGAGILSGIFSVNENKEVVSVSSIIHGIGASIGFMLLLFVPLLLSIIEFKKTNIIMGLIFISVFILGFISFAFFVMSDKEKFKDTFIDNEGLWERYSLFFMYFPFIVN
ncbi:DUF998 domain-containing protein, partial [Treponema pedis]|uniref:DUF998 domain-containing protein n=1 Tax=Treponema pedis TaxID=409322 RepID=UPI00049450C7